MFGTVSAWFYRKLLGITPLEPGYARVSIKPSGIGHASLTHAAATVATPRGDVVVAVASNATSVTLEVTVPVGATALAAIPLLPARAAGSPAASVTAVAISEGGKAVWSQGKFVPGVPGVSAGKAGADGMSIEMELVSGSYAFTATKA